MFWKMYESEVYERKHPSTDTGKVTASEKKGNAC